MPTIRQQTAPMNLVRQMIVLLSLCLALLPSAQAMGWHSDKTCVHQASEALAAGEIEAPGSITEASSECISVVDLPNTNPCAAFSYFALMLEAERPTDWHSANLDGWKRPPRMA
jgi:hypothetical protein